MRTAEATELLTSLCPEADRVDAKLGTRGDMAFLRLWASNNPDRWAVVSTPGDRWFSLDVDGGFSLNHFEEDTAEADVQRIVGQYVDAAVAYVSGDAKAARHGRLGQRALRVTLGQGEVVLRRSVMGSVKDLLRRR